MTGELAARDLLPGCALALVLSVGLWLLLPEVGAPDSICATLSRRGPWICALFGVCMALTQRLRTVAWFFLVFDACLVVLLNTTGAQIHPAAASIAGLLILVLLGLTACFAAYYATEVQPQVLAERIQAVRSAS